MKATRAAQSDRAARSISKMGDRRGLALAAVVSLLAHGTVLGAVLAVIGWSGPSFSPPTQHGLEITFIHPVSTSQTSAKNNAPERPAEMPTRRPVLPEQNDPTPVPTAQRSADSPPPRSSAPRDAEPAAPRPPHRPSNAVSSPTGHIAALPPPTPSRPSESSSKPNGARDGAQRMEPPPAQQGTAQQDDTAPERVPPAHSKAASRPAENSEMAESGPAHSAPRAKGAINPAPDYPWLSRQRGEEGRVILEVTVNPDGRPATVQVAQSSGYRRLDHAARDTVRQWRFDPARRAGVPVPARTRVPVTFRLMD